MITWISAFSRYAARKRREVFRLLGRRQSSTVSMTYRINPGIVQLDSVHKKRMKISLVEPWTHLIRRDEDVGCLEVLLQPMANKNTPLIKEISQLQISSPIGNNSMSALTWIQILRYETAKASHIVNHGFGRQDVIVY